MLKIYFTVFGEVYAGWEVYEPDWNDYKVIIIGTKRHEYNELKPSEKTKEKLKEYGWVIRKDLIVQEFYDKEILEPPPRNNHQTWYGDTNRKIMFIIGAGASANCVFSKDKKKFYADNLRPPLGNQLFEDRFEEFYKNYPGVGDSLYYLQRANTDVEKMLEEDWIDIYESGNLSVMKRHINIQYYLRQIFSKISKNIEINYSSFNLFAQLADKLKRIHARNIGRESPCFAFVSFNQDTILDFFLSKYLLLKLNSFNDYVGINDNPFCLFKPHGSWNWGWRFPREISESINGDKAKWLYENDTNFHHLYYALLGSYAEMVDWRGWGTAMQTHKHNLGRYGPDKNKLLIHDVNSFNAHFPAILLPYRDKDEFIMPPSHYYTLKTYFNYVETLIVIGWKGNEAAFNRLLALHYNIKKIVIVDPNPKQVEENLKDVLSKPNVEKVLYSDFEDFVMTGLEKEMSLI